MIWKGHLWIFCPMLIDLSNLAFINRVLSRKKQFIVSRDHQTVDPILSIKTVAVYAIANPSNNVWLLPQHMPYPLPPNNVWLFPQYMPYPPQKKKFWHPSVCHTPSPPKKILNVASVYAIHSLPQNNVWLFPQYMPYPPPKCLTSLMMWKIPYTGNLAVWECRQN